MLKFCKLFNLLKIGENKKEKTKYKEIIYISYQAII